MPLTIVVRCAPRPVVEPAEASAGATPSEPARDAAAPSPERPAEAAPPPAEDPSITFDSPRIVIGRGDGADLRLPDPSVSHRHASVRARGAEWVLIDEGSTNGTFLEQVRLGPQSPRVLRSGELVRVGRVWLQVRVEHAAMPTARAASAAKELALELVSRALAVEGEDARPRVWVVEGPDKGKELRLEPRRTYLIGRARESDLALEDVDASRRHLELSRRGEQVLVQDLGSKAGATLGGEPLVGQAVPWVPGRELTIGSDRLALANAAADALAELERSPDERMDPSEVIEAPPPPPAPASAAAEPAAAAAAETARDAAVTARAAESERRDKDAEALQQRGWSITDGAVLLLSLGVLLLSVAGLVWLLGR
jgi:pSer/pThr/pTyr-binding forkhead associated (FHA) protein